jgi:hypothetical protein
VTCHALSRDPSHCSGFHFFSTSPSYACNYNTRVTVRDSMSISRARRWTPIDD